MSAPTPTTESQVCRLARMACRAAERAATFDRAFNWLDLSDKERAAGEALLFAALSWVMSARASGKKPPVVLSWEGRRWYLSAHADGRLEVSYERAQSGLLSMPLLYDADALEMQR